MSVSRRIFGQALSAASFVTLTGRRAEAQNISLYQHGVASGDPLVNRVIIWTRLSPTSNEEVIPVEWLMATDPALNRVVQRGLTYTNGAFDYTVKVDVTRLDPNTTYYYRFSVRGATSAIGRTKTLPVGAVERMRIAVASCSNYPFGFFNAYRAIANRHDLDIVLHLGDYIYEYGNAQYGDGTAIGRTSAPDKEIVTLSDYRQRYAQYRGDPDLQEAQRQHPWIVVWDDHESANDSWRSGAQNHSPETEGDWSQRRAVASQAWFDWLPVRENPFLNSEIYRNFQYGNLLDITMLDTRLSGRDQQVAPNSPAVADPNRTLLGPEQEAWLYGQLSTSQSRGARWRILGQQVMMGQLLGAEGPLNADQWDGYLATRNRLLQHLAANQINNVVVLTGDIHTSWGNEIAANPFVPSGSTRQAVEFVTPAITSPGLATRAAADTSQAAIGASHPHVKYVELFRRGYVILDVDRDRAQAEWYHVRTITERTADEEFARALRTSSGENRLVASTEPSRAGNAPAQPAP